MNYWKQNKNGDYVLETPEGAARIHKEFSFYGFKPPRPVLPRFAFFEVRGWHLTVDDGPSFAYLTLEKAQKHAEHVLS